VTSTNATKARDKPAKMASVFSLMARNASTQPYDADHGDQDPWTADMTRKAVALLVTIEVTAIALVFSLFLLIMWLVQLVELAD
jgi:hypothetical protein